MNDIIVSAALSTVYPTVFETLSGMRREKKFRIKENEKLDDVHWFIMLHYVYTTDSLHRFPVRPILNVTLCYIKKESLNVVSFSLLLNWFFMLHYVYTVNHHL
jgi:hypothetical protein